MVKYFNKYLHAASVILWITFDDGRRCQKRGGGKADIGIASRHTQPIRTQIISFFKNL